MAEPILLRILTDAGIALEDQATSIIAPGELGHVGFLSRHAPLVTTLSPGTLTWQRPSGERRHARIGGGILEIAKNRCTLLTTAFSDTEEASSSPRLVGARAHG